MPICMLCPNFIHVDAILAAGKTLEWFFWDWKWPKFDYMSYIRIFSHIVHLRTVLRAKIPFLAIFISTTQKVHTWSTILIIKTLRGGSLNLQTTELNHIPTPHNIRTLLSSVVVPWLSWISTQHYDLMLGNCVKGTTSNQSIMT